MNTGQADDQLLYRSQSGDQQAFAELVERHGAYLFGVAHALVASDHDAEDAVQECLLASLKAKYDARAAVRTWLVGILVRQAALIRRKRKRWLRVFHPSEVAGRLDVADAGSATDAVDAKMDLTVLLSRLTPEYREVIVLRELEQMSYDEIAKVLSLPQGTVESRLFRARAALRQMVKDDEK